jgi:hypothetical protein
LIQRDYSNGGWYNYIYRGGTLREDGTRPPLVSVHTDAASVFGGGGITPDEAIKTLLTGLQVRLRDPIFFFAREWLTVESAL